MHRGYDKLTAQLYRLKNKPNKIFDFQKWINSTTLRQKIFKHLIFWQISQQFLNSTTLQENAQGVRLTNFPTLQTKKQAL